MKFALIASLLLASVATIAFAQPVPTTHPYEAEEPTEEGWSFSLAAYTYIVNNGRDYVSPILTADHDWLHLEARYNYEATETGSVWVGYNFHWGDELAIELTPMIGGVFGDVSGVAPGYRLSIAWKKLEFYSEGEYLFDSEGHDNNYFYAWSELSYWITDNVRAGVAVQRTRAYQSDLDFQPGILLGITWKQLDFNAYVFDLGFDDPVFIFSVGASF